MNISTIRNKFKTWLEGYIRVDYWGVNTPEGYWTSFDNPNGVRVLALPIREIETSPTNMNFSLAYDFMFRFPRDTYYDELPLAILEEWLWNLSRDIQEENQCIFGEVLGVSVTSDSPFQISTDQGSEDWFINILLVVNFSAVYVRSYS